MCFSARVRTYAYTLYAYAHICVYNATHFGYDTFLVHNAFFQWLCSGLKQGRRRIAVAHMTSLLSCRKFHYLHYSSLTTILVFYCRYCYLFLCDICWGFGTERESTKHNIETMNVVYCMTYTDVHKQTSQLHSSLFSLVLFLVSCMWKSITIGL
jgi:hypothetical protein